MNRAIDLGVVSRYRYRYFDKNYLGWFVYGRGSIGELNLVLW